MKTIKLLMTIAIFFMLAGVAGAGVHLAWDANTEPGLIGYIIYYQDTSDMETYNYNAGNVTDFILNDVIPGHSYDIHLKAYNAIGLAGESNHVTWTEPPTFTPPANHMPIADPAPVDVSGVNIL